MREALISPRGGLLRTPRRPSGWIAPGPRPPEEPAREELWPAPGEDLCWLAGDWRILQRTDGHRWSLDDLATAWLAARACPEPPARTIDLGCGLGTVLLFTLWRFPEARGVGVEAQELSAKMARRSLAWNGIEARAEIRHGDFRDPTVTGEGVRYPLITGTPPYFPHGTGLQSDHVQRAPCRFEHRGGVEDYFAAAARLLVPGGRFVACEASSQAARIDGAARASGLEVSLRLDVIPRAGKPPLFCAFVAGWPGELPRLSAETLTVRDASGRWTDEFRALRTDMGMPPGTDTFEEPPVGQ